MIRKKIRNRLSLPASGGVVMKKYFILGIASLLISGCATMSMVTKNFKVIADPSDSTIKVVSGAEQKERRYSSPAEITVEVSKEPAQGARAVLEISKDNYKPVTIPLRHIHDGDTLKIKLDEIVNYRLKYRMLRPVQSDEVKFQDGALSILLTVGEQAFQASLTNLAAYPLKILWEQSQYTDIFGRNHRLMPSSVPYQNRNNPIPDQVVQSRSSIQAVMTPIDNVYVSQQSKNYEVKPLFPREAGTALKGKIFNLFIPVEINRSITPYNFTIEITEVVKEAVKK
jgi:hypothetical protein